MAAIVEDELDGNARSRMHALPVRPWDRRLDFSDRPIARGVRGAPLKQETRREVCIPDRRELAY